MQPFTVILLGGFRDRSGLLGSHTAWPSYTCFRHVLFFLCVQAYTPPPPPFPPSKKKKNLITCSRNIPHHHHHNHTHKKKRDQTGSPLRMARSRPHFTWRRPPQKIPADRRCMYRCGSHIGGGRAVSRWRRSCKQLILSDLAACGLHRIVATS